MAGIGKVPIELEMNSMEELEKMMAEQHQQDELFPYIALQANIALSLLTTGASSTLKEKALVVLHQLMDADFVGMTQGNTDEEEEEEDQT